jgi:hypothetical protein
LLVDARGSGFRKNKLRIRIREAQKLPDPEYRGKQSGKLISKGLKYYHICARTIGGRFDCMKKPLACTPVINLRGEIFYE